MKNIVRGAAAFAILALAPSAFAADLPGRRQAPTPYLAPAPAFTWTGFYAGVNGGYGFGDFTKGGKTFLGKVDGGLFGVTAGYNQQYNQFVVGVEGDLDYSSLSNTKTPFVGVATRSRLSSLTTLRGRLGFAADRALVFVTGGYAGGQVKASIVDTRPGGITGSRSNFRSGYALGAGIEYAFTNNISAKAEYLYTSLSGKNYFTGIDRFNTGLHVSTIRAGLNYRF